MVNPLVVLSKKEASATEGAGLKFNPLMSKFITTMYEDRPEKSYEEQQDDEEEFDHNEMFEKHLNYDSKSEIFNLGSTWRNMQITQPPIKSLIVSPAAGNSACLFAEHYGGRMFFDVCYSGVLVTNPSGVTFRDLFYVLDKILTRHNNVLKQHRDDGALVEQLEDFDEEVDGLEFNLEVKMDEIVQKG